MSTTKPRITITLEPHAYEVLSRLSAANGESMSQIVSGFVDLAVPSLERVVLVLERARSASQEVRTGLASALDRADRVLMPALTAAMDQTDLFLSDVTLASQQQPSQPSAAAASAAPPSRGSKRVSTPGPVTRGSGTGKTRTPAPNRPPGRLFTDAEAEAIAAAAAGRKGRRHG